MKVTFGSIIICCLVIFLPKFVIPSSIFVSSIEKIDISKILKEIYEEMKEFQKYPGCDFIKREFFVGEDDDDTNKDIHVVILVQEVDEKEKVTIQVTYMERRRGRPVVGIAKDVKIFCYFVLGDKTEIIKSEFDAGQKKLVLPGVLQAIKDKKKLLKDIIFSGATSSPLLRPWSVNNPPFV
jgi:hypothetical protein